MPQLPFSRPQDRDRALSRFEALPAELLDMIIHDPQLDPASLLALGLTCQTLWLSVAAHIRAKTLEGLGVWANTPFVATGTYFTTMPPALYQHYPAMKQQEAAFAARPGHRNGACPARRWNWAAYSDFVDVADALGGKPFIEAFDRHRLFLRLPMTPSKNARAIKFYDDLRTILNKHLLDPIPIRSGSKWLLRNHTTKECVQLHVDNKELADARTPHIKDAKNLTVDKILLMRSTWTWERAHRTEMDDVFCQSEWAGHCFDIIPFVKGDAIGEEWQDITQSVGDGKQLLKDPSLVFGDNDW